MSKYRIQHYKSSVTIPAGSGSITDVLTKDMNGLLRGLVITPPATLTGSSYSVAVNSLYSIGSLAAGSTAQLINDSHNNPLQFPVSNQAGDSWLTIAAAGDTAATGTLTDGNTNNVSDNDTVTIGTTVYRFKNTLAQLYDVKIGANADATLLSLAKTINGTGVANTDMFVGTPAHTLVTASSSVTSHHITITANSEVIGGDSIATTSTATYMTWGAATLTGSGEASDRIFGIEAYIER